MFHFEVPGRIRTCIPDCKLIAILRNPADRAYSQYGLRVRNRAERQPFSRFLEEEPDAYERGLYSQQLERYLKYFPRDRMLVLIFERVMQDPQRALTRVAEFLRIDPDLFSQRALRQKIGASYQPRFPRARALALY